MTREEAKALLLNISAYDIDTQRGMAKQEAIEMAIKALEQEPCDNVCEWFEQYVDIVTDIVELRFSDGTVKRAKRGLYMRDIEKSIRRMLIEQMADEKKQEPCEDCISRQAVLDEMYKRQKDGDAITAGFIKKLPPVTPQLKMGRWIDDKCSVCGKGIDDLIDSHEWYRNEEPKFCPFCGIKISEVK